MGALEVLVLFLVAVVAYLLGVWERRYDGVWTLAYRVLDELDAFDLTLGREEDEAVQTARALAVARMLTAVEPTDVSRLDRLDGVGGAR